MDTEAALAALKRSAQQEVVDLDAEDEEAVRCVSSSLFRWALVHLQQRAAGGWVVRPRRGNNQAAVCFLVGRATDAWQQVGFCGCLGK